MIEVIRLLLLLGVAGAAATFLASGAAWWLDEQRRLYRIARKVLDGKPDSMIFALGRSAAAAVRLASRQVLVMRDGGAHALLYQLYNLRGAELIVDNEVAARVLRDQPTRSLDQVAVDARQVTLRLLFDDPRHPDFNLDLWLPRDQVRDNGHSPAAVIREARAWLGRCEAIMPRSDPPITDAPQAQAPAPTPTTERRSEIVEDLLPWEGDSEFDNDREDEEDFDESSSETPRLL